MNAGFPAASRNRTISTDGGLLDHGDPMTSQPLVKVGATDADDLAGDSDEGQTAMASPVADCACRDAADKGKPCALYARSVFGQTSTVSLLLLRRKKPNLQRSLFCVW